MPTQNHSARGKKITEWLKMKVSRITLRWAGLKVLNGCKNPAILHGRWWCRKENVNEEHWQMKNNNKMKIKNEMTTNITKTSQRFSQASTITGSFYSESEPDFSNFDINSLSSKSESDDSESDFNSVFINFDICVFLPYIYTLLNKLADDFFYQFS